MRTFGLILLVSLGVAPFMTKAASPEVERHGPIVVTGATTFTLLGKPMALYGLNPPPAGWRCGDRACAAQSQEQLTQVTQGQTVDCVIKGTIPHGVPLAVCSTSTEVDLASYLVSRGLGQSSQAYVRDQTFARTHHLGMWAIP